MEDMTKSWLVPFLLLLVTSCMQHCVYGESQVPGLFIFGDSVSDNGNNNNLATAAKANFKPYGIDFPEGPTGRFTNGRTIVDVIGQLLGFKNFIPPFANISGSDILKGVNYASGAAGIRFESGTHLGPDISLGAQLANHRVVFSQIATKLGGFDKAVQYLSKCLYFVSIGSNDYLNNYFLPKLYSTSRNYNPDQYAQILVDQLSLHVQGLRDMGARKYVLVGLALIGCTPGAMSTHRANGSCVQDMNAAAYNFNDKLKALVDQLNNKFSADSKFIFINLTAVGSMGSVPPCCPTREDGQCVPNQMPCQNRNEHVFYDEYHTTEAINLMVAMASYNASNQAFTYPMDIKHLVQSKPTLKFKEL